MPIDPNGHEPIEGKSPKQPNVASYLRQTPISFHSALWAKIGFRMLQWRWKFWEGSHKEWKKLSLGWRHKDVLSLATSFSKSISFIGFPCWPLTSAETFVSDLLSWPCHHSSVCSGEDLSWENICPLTSWEKLPITSCTRWIDWAWLVPKHNTWMV